MRSMIRSPGRDCTQKSISSRNNTHQLALRTSVIPHSSSVLESSRPIVSAHPDAVRRRKEFEALQREREAERARDRELESIGKKWWYSPNLPSNLQCIDEPTELMSALERAALAPGLMVLNYFSEECYTCKTLYPKVKQLALAHPDVKFLKVNGSSAEMQQVFPGLGITKVPYFQLYKKGVMLSHFTASLSPEKLAKLRLEIRNHAQL